MDRGDISKQYQRSFCDQSAWNDACRHPNLPGAVIIGGGLVVESGGTLVGAIGVSGAPGGDADEACAEAGIAAIQFKLDFFDLYRLTRS